VPLHLFIPQCFPRGLTLPLFRYGNTSKFAD
jgi:hypothetical protein